MNATDHCRLLHDGAPRSYFRYENSSFNPRRYFEKAERFAMGTLNQILEECGYSRSGKQIRSREFFSVQRVPLPDLLT